MGEKGRTERDGASLRLGPEAVGVPLELTPRHQDTKAPRHVAAVWSAPRNMLSLPYDPQDASMVLIACPHLRTQCRRAAREEGGEIGAACAAVRESVSGEVGPIKG